MFLIYNLPGIYITGIGCLAAILANRIAPESFAGATFLGLGLAWIAADIFYRFKWGQRRLFHPRHGGHLYYIPMWILGLLSLCLVLPTRAPATPPPPPRHARPATNTSRPASSPFAATRIST